MPTNRNRLVSDIEDQVRIKTDTRNDWRFSPILYLDIINQCTSDIARKLIDQANQFYAKKSSALTITANLAPLGTTAYHKILWCEGNNNPYIPLVSMDQLKRASKFSTAYSASVLAAHEGENIMYFAGSDATSDTSIYLHYIAQPAYATARTDLVDLPDEYVQQLIDAVAAEINSYRTKGQPEPGSEQVVQEGVQSQQQSGALEKQGGLNG